VCVCLCVPVRIRIQLVTNPSLLSLPFEIIIVDWNSNPQLLPVATDLRAQCLLFLPLRVIVVPPSLHALHPNPNAIPLILTAAKNAGARRARGNFIVFTNADDIFPPKLLLHLTAATLQPGRVYRTMRWEVHARPPLHSISGSSGGSSSSSSSSGGSSPTPASVDYSTFLSDWSASAFDPYPTNPAAQPALFLFESAGMLKPKL
jgi:hypothetical protein